MKYYTMQSIVFFTAKKPDRKILAPILLVGGSHHTFNRISLAVDVLAEIRRYNPDARLVIAGRFRWRSNEKSAEAEIRKYVHDLLLDDYVDWAGAYKQTQAPDLFRQADLLLHVKYNDPCPRLVVEAMASGLPVVYSASGGVPELVGDKAGVGVPVPLDWERMHSPSAANLVEATRKICMRYEEFSSEARKRAVEKFDVKPWIQRHKEVFTELLNSKF